jgi:hypothetical protein
MSLILSGTDGLSDVDGSAATPAIRGTDANTGIFFPAADTIAFSEGGAEAARFDSAGSLLVGQTSSVTSGRGVTINTSQQGVISRSGVADYNELGVWTGTADTVKAQMQANQSGKVLFGSRTNHDLIFTISDTEKARIDTSGNLLVGTTGVPNGTSIYGSGFTPISFGRSRLSMACSSTSGLELVQFFNPNGQVGNISTSGSATAYNTSSDYRLKENIAPMTGALTRVAALKPVTYKWKVDGENGEGFIAHELAEVVPQCVTGEKDAVDENGKPAYQGIDVSFLVATLTAAIQEQQTLIESLKARLDAANL